MLHVSCAIRLDPVGHAAPPNSAARVIERERLVAPVPQLTEHVDHEPQSSAMQSTGQDATLHALVSTAGAQGMPPSLSMMSPERERLWVPPPHEAVQLLYWAAQVPGWQSEGHGLVLHARTSLRYGQA